MSADEPGFDVAEQGMDDREELTGIGAVVLHHRGVRQMLAEGGIAAAIAGEPVGQEMGPRCDIRLEEGAEFDARRGWQNRDPGVAGEEAVLALHRVPVLSCLVLWCRHLLDGGDDQAFVGAGRAATATGRIAAAADEGLIRLEKAAQRTGRILAQTMAQLVRHGPGRLICHPQFALQKFGRDAAFGRDPSGRRQETTSRDPSASDETRFPPSPIPADGRCRIRRPAAARTVATPPARRSRNTQTRRASEAQPSARCTAPPPRTGLQNPEVQPFAPPLTDWAMLP